MALHASESRRSTQTSHGEFEGARTRIPSVTRILASFSSFPPSLPLFSSLYPPAPLQQVRGTLVVIVPSGKNSPMTMRALTVGYRHVVFRYKNKLIMCTLVCLCLSVSVCVYLYLSRDAFDSHL